MHLRRVFKIISFPEATWKQSNLDQTKMSVHKSLVDMLKQLNMGYVLFTYD